GAGGGENLGKGGAGPFPPPAPAPRLYYRLHYEIKNPWALLAVPPITGIAGCCARAASGHATVAPPSSVMNSRLFTRSPAHEHRADSSSILCIEPCVDNFLCLDNNRFFGTFLKRCRTFGQRR